MRMKSKPEKPKQKRYYRSKPTWEGVSVQELLDEYGPEATIEMGWDRGYEHLVVCYSYVESDEEFAKRMDSYKRRLATYEEWYEENKEAIEAELADRAAKKQAKEEKAKARKIAALEKELKKLKK